MRTIGNLFAKCCSGYPEEVVKSGWVESSLFWPPAFELLPLHIGQ